MTPLGIIVRVIFWGALGYFLHPLINKIFFPYRANYNKLSGASYSQMGIYVDGKEYSPLDECIVTFEKKTGWTAWDRDARESIGSERQGNICITVDGIVVIGKLPEEE